eukprot:TRINITY_DN34529_c0_g1_i2.p1 TRINITY_DN34529_c0_g1~~TRINITY_DN34529_c0_g1_i2.p1  ORF type:complete len:434 (-),score=117.68 TRINITY_DN34529_c0_g1_i2:44-1345(-)
MQPRMDPGTAGHQAGIALLQDLLRKPPAEVASWALEQVKTLSSAGSNVEALPIFQVAGALNAVPLEQKTALVRHAIAGFGELPAQKRAEVVRIAMQTADVAHRAENLALHEQMASEHAAALGRLASLQNGGAPPAAPAQPSDAALESAPPLVKNFMKVVKEARFDQMPKADMQSLAQDAQREAQQLAQPQQLLDVVAELKPDEREQLTEVLVDANVVPQEQRVVLEEAMRPGGYADQISSAVSALEAARQYAWLFLALPCVELFFSLVLGNFACGSGLPVWLRGDAWLALGTVGAGYFGMQQLEPVYEQLKEDPMGAVQRWQATEGRNLSTSERLEQAVPGVKFDAYQIGGLGLGIALILFVIGLVGVLELLATIVMGCSAITVFVCFVFIGIRCGAVVGLLFLARYVSDEINKHRARLEPDTSPLLYHPARP